MKSFRPGTPQELHEEPAKMKSTESIDFYSLLVSNTHEHLNDDDYA